VVTMRETMAMVVCLLVFLSIGLMPATAELQGWQYQKEITIRENSGTTLADYQVLLELSGSYFPSGAKSDGADLRFTNAQGNALSYWIEEFNPSAKTARVWVKVPSIPTNGETDISMYYGNENAPSVSDGIATFVWFDEYENQNLGATPAGWKLTTPKWGSCIITEEKKKSGTKSVKYVDTSTISFPCAYVTFPAQTEKFIFEVDYLVKEVSVDISPYISDSYTQCASGANILFQNNSDMRYWDGSFYNYIQRYNLDQWYSIRHDIDLTNGRVNIWVDGTKKINNGKLLGTRTVMDRFYIDGGNPLGTSTVYIDNPRIRKYTSLEPTISISAELPIHKAQALMLTKSASNATIQEGETTTITIKVENTGLEDAKAVEVTDTISTGFEIVSGSSEQQYDTLKPKEYRTYQYTLKATENGRFVSDPATATFTDDNGNSYSSASNSVTITVSASSQTEGSRGEEEKGIPGFEVVFGLTGLLVVVAYIALRRKR
jgi:uncharacterized repeat protein (TIGR01451 family)